MCQLYSRQLLSQKSHYTTITRQARHRGTQTSVLSDTSTEVDNDPWSAVDALISLHVPMRSSLKMYQDVSDAQGSLFKVPSRRKGQRPIIFGRVKSKSITREEARMNPSILSL